MVGGDGHRGGRDGEAGATDRRCRSARRRVGFTGRSQCAAGINQGQDMTDDTEPEAREFTMSQYASKDDMIGAMRKRIAELESELEAVGAGGVSGPLMGRASLSANAGEPVAWQYRSLRDNGAWFDCTKERFEMRCTQPEIWETRALYAAPKAAPEVGDSGFDYKTAADFLNGKTVSDEAARKFVATSRWAHDERAALSATLLAMHGVLTSREAEIALLKKALLEAEAAPQQEAQEPVVIYHGRCTIDCGEHGHHDMEMLRMIPSGSKLYTAPQPAPAPLSERDAFERDWEKRHTPAPINGRTHDDGRYGDSSIQDAWESWQARAALAAQGGKDA